MTEVRSPESALAAYNEAIKERQSGNFSGAVKPLRRALDYFRVHNSRAAASVAFALADSYRRIGELNEALECYTESQILFTQIGEATHAAEATRLRGGCYRSANRWADAKECFSAARDHYLDTGDFEHAAESGYWLSDVHEKLEEYDAAEIEYGRARELFEKTGNAGRIADCTYYQASMLRFLGRSEDALAEYQRLTDSHDQVGATGKWLAEARYWAADCEAELGHHQTAIELLTAAIPFYVADGHLSSVANCHYAIGNRYRDLGDQACAAAAYRTASASYDQAGNTDKWPAEARYWAADCEAKLGHHQTAIELLTEAITLNIEHELTDHTAKYHNALGHRYGDLGDYRCASESFGTAQVSFASVGDALESAHSEMHRARSVLQGGDLVRAAELLEAGALSYKELGDQLAHANALVEAGNAYRTAELLPESLQRFTESRVLFSELGNTQQARALQDVINSITYAPRAAEMQALLARGRELAEAREWEQAVAIYAEARAIAAETGDIHIRSFALQEWFMQHFGQGNYGTILEEVTRELSLARAAGDTKYVAFCSEILGSTHRQIGEFASAEEHYLRAAGIYEQSGSGNDIARLKHQLGDIYLSSGRAEEARVAYTLSRELFRTAGVMDWYGHSTMHLANTYPDEEAEPLFIEARDTYNAMGLDNKAVRVTSALGHIAERRGDLDAAEAAYLESIRIHTRDHDYLELAEADFALASLHWRRNDVLNAEKHFERAVDTFVAFGVFPRAALCDVNRAALWSAQAQNPTTRNTMLSHAVDLMLPAVLYLNEQAHQFQTASHRQSWKALHSVWMNRVFEMVHEIGDTKLISELVEMNLNTGVYSTQKVPTSVLPQVSGRMGRLTQVATVEDHATIRAMSLSSVASRLVAGAALPQLPPPKLLMPDGSIAAEKYLDAIGTRFDQREQLHAPVQTW